MQTVMYKDISKCPHIIFTQKYKKMQEVINLIDNLNMNKEGDQVSFHLIKGNTVSVQMSIIREKEGRYLTEITYDSFCF